jgi:hypothetical protein
MGKKHGPCTYSWPNGAKYFVTYVDGKAKNDGKLVGATIPIEQIKAEYASLAKKTSKSVNFLKENLWFVKEPDEPTPIITKKPQAALKAKRI